MKFFIDTAEFDEIKEAYAFGFIDGVTTNPSLIVKAKRDLKQVISEIANLVEGPVSAEVIASDAEGMIGEAHELVKLGSNVVIKVPMTPEGLKAVAVLSKEGIKTNVTLIFSANQALLAARAGAIDITKSLTENIKNVAAKMNRNVDEITLVMLDRERHHGLMKEARDLGARIMLISDGDVNPAMECCIEGSGVHMVVGTGGAPEGVLAAAALKCVGGDMQARLKPETEEEIRRCHEMGITDVNQVLTLDDLVRTDDVIFAATAITRGNLLNAIQYFPGGARTHTIVMRSKTGTVRFLDTVHMDEKLKSLKAK